MRITPKHIASNRLGGWTFTIWYLQGVPLLQRMKPTYSREGDTLVFDVLGVEVTLSHEPPEFRHAYTVVKQSTRPAALDC